jgi:hypothetical protein
MVPMDAERTRPPSTSAGPEGGASRSGPGATPGLAYRSDHDRQRALRRRANPWYRQLARGTVGLILVAALGLGLYFGAGALQDYFVDDELPEAGLATPGFRRTSFLVTSDDGALAIGGTLTVDTDTLAFEYFGRPNTDQEGVRIVSPDGERTYLDDSGTWVDAEGEPTTAAIRAALPYLLGVESSDDVIGDTAIERRYVELSDRRVEGSGDDRLRVYDVVLDASRLRSAAPARWQDIVEHVAPDLSANDAVTMTFALDEDDVVRRLHVPAADWEWQRLAYSPDAFIPIAPDASLPTSDDG